MRIAAISQIPESDAGPGQTKLSQDREHVERGQTCPATHGRRTPCDEPVSIRAEEGEGQGALEIKLSGLGEAPPPGDNACTDGVGDPHQLVYLDRSGGGRVAACLIFLRSNRRGRMLS